VVVVVVVMIMMMMMMMMIIIIIIIIDKRCMVINVTIPADGNVTHKEAEKKME
jgi:hypothetical protein